MFGVLVVVLCPDRVADLGFSAGKRQIPLIVSLRILKALRLRAAGTEASTASNVQRMMLQVWVGAHS